MNRSRTARDRVGNGLLPDLTNTNASPPRAPSPSPDAYSSEPVAGPKEDIESIGPPRAPVLR